MAWIEQTKKGSIKSGGPQYYLQELSENNRDLLRAKVKCPVRLWTPYGVVLSGLVAVSSSVGKVGHDRVQSGRKVPSIADQVAWWYALRISDIERIEFEDCFDDDSFVIRPTRIKFRGRGAFRTVYPDSNPLTWTPGHRSPFLLEHLGEVRKRSKEEYGWIASQIAGMADQHAAKGLNVDERDLLRASGALQKLGINLGMYRSKAIDCADGTFSFRGFPEYPCPIEIEEKSSGFLATHHAPHRRQRLVVLCMQHNERSVLRRYVDVLELRELGRFLRETA